LKKVGHISDEELDSLTTAIKNRYGIDFTGYERKSLKRGFARLIMKKDLDSILELWFKIMRDRNFLLDSIDELTVNLTELFRNPEIWVKLKDEVLPKFQFKPDLNLWHAGCSSGEEVYTMAIILKYMNMHANTSTLATDLSSSILKKAQDGIYSNILKSKYSESFSKSINNGNIDSWFTQNSDNKHIQVIDSLKRNIKFERHNLVHDDMDQKFDIIFCRNVMIYFDDSLKMKVLELFNKCLKEDGFFVIGYYDMLPIESKDLFDIYDSKTRIYKKNYTNS